MQILLRALLFEGRLTLTLNPGFFSVCSKAFFLDNFLSFFRASNHQIVGKRNNTEFAFKAFLSEIKFATNPGLT